MASRDRSRAQGESETSAASRSRRAKLASAAQDRPRAPESVRSHVKSILAAAERSERAADGIREDAREWARNYLKETDPPAHATEAEAAGKASRLSESLISRGRTLAEQSEKLITALDEIGQRGARERPDRSRATSDKARLLVTRMAVAGSTRDEISRRLRKELGIEDPGAVLDEIGV